MSSKNKRRTAEGRLEGITNPAYEPEPGYAWDGCMALANSHPRRNNNDNNNGSGIKSGSGIGAILNDSATNW